MEISNEVLFIARNNVITNQLYNELSGVFHIQFCMGTITALEASLSFVRPKLAVVCLAGCIGGEFLPILKMLKNEALIPTIVICDEEQYNALLKSYVTDNFKCVLRPTTLENIVYSCKMMASGCGDLLSEKATSEEVVVERAHVLIIDDNPITLRTTKRLLDDNFSVAIATSGSQAFMSIAKKLPDVILLDYEMPIIDGEATMKMLKDNPETKDIPVIFFTSVASPDVVKKLIALSPAGYVLKPPEKEKLIILIEKTLSER